MGCQPMRILAPLLALGVAGAAWGHAPGGEIHPRTIEGPAPWTSLQANNDPDHFQFVVVTDRTGGHRPGVFSQGVEKTNLMQPQFVVSVGDLIEGYTEDLSKITGQWDEFQGIVAQLQMPFFYVPGNHDLTNPVMAAEWTRRFGPAYYHFVYRNVLFLCLNTEDGQPTHISDEQIAYFADVLEQNKNVRWTLLFMHKPLWVYEEGRAGHEQFKKIEQLLQGRDYTVFAGHLHKYTRYVRHDHRYIILATTGGASNLRGPLFGRFDHVVWVTMRDDGPRIANLMLDGIADENITTEQSLKLAESLDQGLRVEAVPIYITTETFTGRATSVALHNNTEHPVTIDATVGPSGQLHPVPHTFHVELAAGEARSVPIDLRADAEIPADSLAVIAIDWTADFGTIGDRPYRFGNQASIGFPRSNELTTCRDAVTIDGRLDEWGDLPFVVNKPAEILGKRDSWTGPGDANFRFNLTMDGQAVYLAIQVNDDAVIAEPDGSVGEQDALKILLNPQDDPQRANNRDRYENNWTSKVFLAFSPSDNGQPVATFEPQRVPERVKIACIKTPSGYNAEIAIPHEVLDQLRGKGVDPWSALRLNIMLDDVDETGGPNAMLHWQPAWNGKNNQPASGTFMRPSDP
ncbi:MAG: metallophosphoesterase [Phycisphaeraceae bacterium]|nr:metallophosphoesterase [Phycisphaeraceae bacterium]